MPLPEKDFFTLDEIISRWRFSQCDRATLLDYARRDLLIFSVYLRDLGHYRTIEETAEARVTTTHSVDFQFKSSSYEWHSIRYLKADDARRILEANAGEEVGVSVLYSEPSRLRESGIGYLQPMYFKYADVLLTRAERDRFEAANKIKLASGQIGKAWTWLSDSSNQKALSLIGVGIAAAFGAAWTVFQWWAKSGSTP